MIFARYIGVKQDSGFTVGKVYPATPEVNSTDTVYFGFIEIVNDAGVKVRVNPVIEKVKGQKTCRYDFEFVEEVYAVISKPFEDLKIGQVVVVDDANSFEGPKGDGGTWQRIVYGVKGIGFRSSDGLVLLDRTNIFPGMIIREEAKGQWVKVKSVDECLWVVVEGSDNRRSPEEFRFCVDRDGDILIEPLAECIDVTGAEDQGLSQGKYYRVIREESSDSGVRVLFVINDLGKEQAYLAFRFLI